jgi:hypothetical protein
MVSISTGKLDSSDNYKSTKVERGGGWGGFKDLIIKTWKK